MIAKTIACLLLLVSFSASAVAADEAHDYRVLATNKTSTMEKEMNDAAGAGFRFDATMGGATAFGGKEVVAVMSKEKAAPAAGRYAYRLLATSKTSTMEKELQQAGNEGFEYKDQTVFKSAFGGEEVVVILEMDRQSRTKQKFEYRLLATARTSTMQKELQQAADEGFAFVGLTVGKTAFSGTEVVSILRRELR